MVRVVAGEFRGRKLQVPGGRNTRPTSERARAGLFDWLGPKVGGARVLDLYAGCGSLGIEALSRGAAEGIFVEKALEALRSLRQNLADLDLEARARVRAGDTLDEVRGLAASGERFEIVLLDPPYAAGEWQRLGQGAALGELLEPEGELVVEHSARDADWPAPPGLVHRDRKLYGETAFERYLRCPER